MGSRSEVLALSLMEALGHMCMLKDEEEAERERKDLDYYIRYKTLEVFHPVDRKDAETANARRKFEESLTPRSMKKGNKQLAPPKPKEFKWDFEDKE